MSIAIMQPYFFPYLGYFQLINLVDVFVLYDDVTYIKGGYINRNKIYQQSTSNLWGIPLYNASSNTLIKDIKFIKGSWSKLLKTIKQNYSKAPYFDEVYQLLVDISENKECESIADLNTYAIKKACEYIGIFTFICRSSELNIVTKGRVERLVSICKYFNKKVYLNAVGGSKLYTKEEFAKNGIELYFLQMTPLNYKQFTDYPIDNLSIIDVMMFNSKVKINEYLIKNFVIG